MTFVPMIHLTIAIAEAGPFTLGASLQIFLFRLAKNALLLSKRVQPLNHIQILLGVRTDVDSLFIPVQDLWDSTFTHHINISVQILLEKTDKVESIFMIDAGAP